ncbi:hypothetical protein AGMMS49944_30430 [Spirochaetia bacterium]|nr:hypothetical protein AGMMS49944_30430 [Spirochaetia bacterium]
MKLPTAEIIAVLENETSHLEHGIVTLALHVRDGRLARIVSTRETSIIPGKSMSGSEQRGAEQ